jgi:hypothetical protein
MRSPRKASIHTSLVIIDKENAGSDMMRLLSQSRNVFLLNLRGLSVDIIIISDSTAMEFFILGVEINLDNLVKVSRMKTFLQVKNRL